MHANAALIERFYQSFATLDADGVADADEPGWGLQLRLSMEFGVGGAS